jgi:NADPH2:quinone reductase
MKAVGIHEHGGHDKLVPLDLPRPTPGEHDLLVEVHASAVNPVDFKIRQGYIGKDALRPRVLGYDVSGVVVEVGKAVEGFKVGDAVFASPALVRHGADAEYVLVDYRTAAPKPHNLGHRDAAALPLVTLTAWESLHDHGRLHTDETVLIHAGGGGVGHIAIQLAKLHGSTVLTTASSDESIALCRKLGADAVINHRTEDVVQRVREETGGALCDVVLDCVGGEAFKTSLDCVGVDGRLVTIVGVPDGADVNSLKPKNASLHMEFMGAATMWNIRPQRQGETLRTVTELVEAGRLTPHVSHVFPLDELAKAHEQQETGRTVGKIVITVK